MKEFTRFDAAATARFWSKVDKSGECWIWTAGLDSHGYGQFYFDGKPSKAHRAAFPASGLALPSSILDHTCHNRVCVRPSHLRPSTTKQNRENLSGPMVNNKSGVTGVHWVADRKRWRAMVAHNGRQYFVGRFKDLADAEAAVIAKRNELFTHNDLDRAA